MRSFAILYLETKYCTSTQCLTIQACNEDEACKIFDNKYPTYYFINICELPYGNQVNQHIDNAY